MIVVAGRTAYLTESADTMEHSLLRSLGSWVAVEQVPKRTAGEEERRDLEHTHMW